MVASVLSASWYRVENLHPRLREHAQIHRLHYRGQLWYVLEDHSGGKHHRFSPAAFYLIGLLNGERTVDAVWQKSVEHLGNEAPTQDEVIGLLAQLHAADVLMTDVPPDTLELFERYKKGVAAKWKQRLSSPLSVKIPLWDPEIFLARTMWLVRPLFSWGGLILWLLVVGFAVTQVGVHWEELSGSIVDQVMAPQNLILLGLVYPVVKALHEMGHAYAIKNWGGEVHEIGVMFLVFMPVPYVDASAASAFRDNRKRVVVGAAGIIVELFLASLALFVWASVEPGTVRSIAYNVMLIGGISTVLFNGNPLLRFDGYHMLADAVEVPNLGTRSNRYLIYLFQRYVLRLRSATNPVTTAGEVFWLPVYGVASFVYRMLIMAVIVVFVATKFFFVGVLIAVWSLFTLLVVPLFKAGRFLLFDDSLRIGRVRFLAVTVMVCVVLGGLLFWLPAPLRTQVEGVVWLPEQSIVRAGTAGTVVELLAEPNAFVAEGEPLAVLDDPFLATRVRLLERRFEELRLRHANERKNDLVKARNFREQMAEVEQNLSKARQQLDKLVVKSPAEGTFAVPQDADLPGKFLAQGEPLGYVLDEAKMTARVVVSQNDVALVRGETRGVQLRFSEDASSSYPVSVRREVPGASERLPNAALGSNGGGPFAVDPRDSSGLKTFDKVFQFDVTLPEHPARMHVGGRVYVRFDHGTEPVGIQLYRGLRQLLLKQFSV